MKTENLILIIFMTLILMIYSLLIMLGVIVCGDKTFDIETESYWYRCSTLLCQDEMENNCSSVKLGCEACCLE